MKKNGFFQLVSAEGGTYLRVFPSENGGEKVKIGGVKKYLDSCCIKEYDLIEAEKMLRSNREVFDVKISDNTFWPVSEKLELLCDKDRKIAVAKFYPPSSDGKYYEKSDIIDELHRQGIVYGIMDSNIDKYIADRQYNMNIFVAKATLPIEGRDGEIKYFFSSNNTSKPRRNADGSVDFHNLDTMSRVQKGDILAKLTPAVLGTPGTDVKGNKIIPKKVKIKTLKKTNQTKLSEDGLTLYSLVSGHVTLVEGKVFVSDTYEVPADVDASTGDVNYDGNVVVKGNVRTGYKVHAKGNIFVNGVVEGACLYADGDIVLKRGIQGMNRGILESKGNIVAKFIENSVVQSGGNVQTEAIMHSKVEAKETITIVGKKGLVTGGELKAGSQILLKTAGSAMGTLTILETGCDPEVSDRFIQLQGQIKILQQEKQKMEQVYQLLKAKCVQGMKLTADKIAMIRVLPTQIEEKDKKLTEDLEEYENLKEQLEEVNNGSIIVQNMAYPGVKIIITGIIKYIRVLEHHSKYFKEDGEIKSSVL